MKHINSNGIVKRIGFVLASLTLLTSCAKEETKEYVLSDVYVSAEELVKQNEKSQSCEDIFINEDGSLTLVLTESQRQYWADPDDMNASLNLMKNFDVSIEYSDDFRVMEVIAPAGVAKAASPMVSSFVWKAEVVQVLNGTQDWSVKVIVRDSETDKVWQEVTLPDEELDWSFLETEK